MLLATAALPAMVRAATSEGLPTRGPIAPYLMPSRRAEIALARSAAPPSIAAHATVLVLTRRGFVTAVKGTNGFVCVVERSWTAPFNDTEFWNPKERGPDCYNPPATRTEIPQLLQEAKWALGGLTRQQMEERTKLAFADRMFKPPYPGAFGFMLSKMGYLNHAHGPWYPHIMFFIPRDQIGNWAPNLKNSPTIAVDRGPYFSTLIMVPVPAWSDGSPAPH
uniref:Uncharacterized protein n=1 Tax=mine drainage metagenome TaxID=410659 RepID=E6Q0U6_9ZZZZ